MQICLHNSGNNTLYAFFKELQIAWHLYSILRLHFDVTYLSFFLNSNHGQASIRIFVTYATSEGHLFRLSYSCDRRAVKWNMCFILN